MGNRCCSKTYGGASDPRDAGNTHVIAAQQQPDLVAALAAAALAAMPDSITVDAAWLNGVVERVWPHFSQSLVKVVLRDMQAKMEQYLPAWAADKLQITRFSVGKEVPKVDFLVSTRGTYGLAVEAAFAYSSDLDFAVTVGSLHLGMSSVKASGHLKVTLGPLIGDVPVIGAVSFAFLDPPDFQYQFTALAQALEHSPLVKNVIRVALDGIIAREAVSPNALVIPLVEGATELVNFGLAAPLGVLRATAVRAGGLTASDWHLLGKRSSDPYLRVRVADQQWTSPVVRRTVDPEWTKGNTFDFMVYDSAQRAFVDIYDEDAWGGDDYLGCLAPLKLDEALAASGRQLPVFESRLAVGGTSDRGHLEMQWTWLAPVTASLDVHGNLMTKDIIVVVEVGSVVVPASVAEPVQVRMKVGDREELSRCLRPDDPAHVAAAVAASRQAFHDIVRRSAKEGLGLDMIAQVTGLDRQTVALLMRDETAPASAELDKKLSVALPFNARLCIPVSAALTKKQPLVLELAPLGKPALARASLTFADIGLEWPMEGKPRTLKLQGAYQFSATVELHVVIMGLEPGRLA